MPVSFLSNQQRENYGRYSAALREACRYVPGLSLIDLNQAQK